MPTFGNNAGTSVTSIVQDRKMVSRYQAPANGLVTKLTMKLDGLAGSGTAYVKGVIYADSSGSPGALLGVSSEVSFPSGTTAAEMDFAFSPSILITSGTYYHIGYHVYDTNPDGYVARIYFTDGVSGYYNDGDTYSDGPTDPFGSTSTHTVGLWCYATYTTAVASGICAATSGSSGAASDSNPATGTCAAVSGSSGVATGQAIKVFIPQLMIHGA